MSDENDVIDENEGVRRPHLRGMNEFSSDVPREELPFPARQQLGDTGGLTDARSGGGVTDTHHEVGMDGLGGHQLQPVTYHLERTPPPSDPPGAPGSDGYNRNVVGAPAAKNTTADRTAGGNVIAARHPDSGPITSQREQTGRNDRIVGAATETIDETDATQSSTDAGRHAAAGSDASAGGSHAEVPNDSIAAVMDWVKGDPARARRAEEAEQQRPTPRQTLLTQLAEIQ